MLNRGRMRAVAWLLVMSTATATVYASGPANQTSNLAHAVRVMINRNATTGFSSMNGSGSIIANLNRNGQGWFCVLTADHVVSSTGTAAGATHANLGVAYGNSPTNSGDGLSDPATVVFRKVDAAVDLAVLGVHYGTYNAAFNNRVASLWDPLSPDPQIFAAFGYGARGDDDPANNQWLRTPTYGTQRFWAASCNAIANVSPFGGYTFQGVSWDVIGAGAANAVSGQGISYDGDSGSGYMSDSLMNIGGKNVYTNKIFAVHSYGTTLFNATYPNGYTPYGRVNGGVYLNAAYLQWVRAKCDLVPEPASFAALGLGFIAFARRRKKS